LARGSGRKNEARALGEVFYDCQRHGVALRSVQDDPYVTDEAFVGMASKMANKYSDDLSGYTKAGMKRRAARGLYTGRRPYGYRNDPERGLVPIPAEAKVVKRIFAEHLAGRSRVAIARGLHEDGVPTASGRATWKQPQVSAILLRAIYAGQVEYDGETHDGQHEAIIDADTWRRACAMRPKGPGKGRGRLPKGNHLFRGGLLRCGSCGEAMVPRTDSRGYTFYCCNGHVTLGAAHCAQGCVSRAKVDEAVFNYFMEVGVDMEATKAALQEAHDRRLAEVRAALRDAEAEAQKAREAFSRVKRDYTSGKLDADDWREFKPELTSEREAADALMTRLREQEADVVGWTDLKDAEAEVLRHLTAIRKAITGEIREADGLDAVRAAISRLFVEFTYLGDSDEIVPKRRGSIIRYDLTDLENPVIDSLTPSRVPLELAVEKYGEGSLAEYLSQPFAPIQLASTAPPRRGAMPTDDPTTGPSAGKPDLSARSERGQHGDQDLL
jgi:hypothetical protein